MRLAYVTETYPPEINGVALTADRALRHLREAGHQVQLLRPRQRGEPPRRDTEEWRTAGGPIPMYPELRFGLATVAALRRRWRQTQPELVHVTTPGPLAFAALRAARAEGLPTTADFRTNFHAYSRHYGFGALEPLLLAYLKRLHAMADRNFVPTPRLAAELSAHGFQRLDVVGRGVDAQAFAPKHRDANLRARWGAGPEDTVLLHVGRLAPEKNVGLALQTFEALRERLPRLRLVVVGDGPLRAPLQARHPGVRFAGVQRGETLAQHYASADVFLFPSLTDTFGNVVLEALASGLALVAFDTAAAGLHVRQGVNGCLAVPGDEAGFVSAARLAVQQAAPGAPMRRAAREAALRCDWPTVLRAFELRLRGVVAEARDARGVHDAALA